MPTLLARQERLKQLELAEQIAGVGYWSHDISTADRRWSPEMFRIFGFAPPEPPSVEQFLAVFLPGDAARLRPQIERALSIGESYEFEGRIRLGDGQVRYVTISADCLLDETGELAALSGVSCDVTDKVRTDHLTRTLLSRIPVMAAHYTPDLRCTFASGRYLEWTGQTPDELVGLHARDVMGADLYEENAPYIVAVLKGEPQDFERELTQPDGRRAHLLAQYLPDLDEDGLVEGFFILANDVTALSEARDEARAAAQAKSEFLATMSHELRTPLTSIIGFGELLAGATGLPAEAQAHVQRIRDASLSLLATVNDILDFSKVDAGQVELESLPFDPRALAQGALDLMQPQADAKGLARTFEGCALPASLLGDETRLRQILLNLIGNAIKFTPHGRITLTATYAAGVLRYAVADTGIGIAAHKQARLFHRFSQVDASTSRTFGGTGLGLAICRGLVEAMGGRIGMESNKRQGSTFWFEIPCHIAPAEAAPDPANDGADIDLAEALVGLKLLVVDDNRMNRELVRLVCQPFGVELSEADGGAVAVAEAASQAFDLILMDIRMPDVDGPAAATLIRQQPGLNRATPIIAFSADSRADQPNAWPELFDAQLAKPVVAIDLLVTLATFRRALDGRTTGSVSA